jgi:hypothetical protein
MFDLGILDIDEARDYQKIFDDTLHFLEPWVRENLFGRL